MILSEWWVKIQSSELLWSVFVLGVSALVGVVLHVVFKKLILKLFSYLAHKTKTVWDDILVEHEVFSPLAVIAPAMLFYYVAPFVDGTEAIRRLSAVVIVFGLVRMSLKVIDASYQIYKTLPVASKGHTAIKGYVQLLKIFISILGFIVMISFLIGKSPLVLLSGIGAMTAVLLLIFKDTILALVASIQISSYNILAIGDWIEMPEYGADGDVVEMNLHTIQVQNWDKTVVSIPTHKFLDNSFKNWRQMFQSGGRRIKRAIYIDMGTIRFCDDSMLERFKKIACLEGYLDSKLKEITLYNQSLGVADEHLINGRNLTNIGTLRAYIRAYLLKHEQINHNMTFLVRQLAPTEKGLPLEIYVFSRETRWAPYEDIQSDIFDHILAVIPQFDLKVFQNPSGNDLQRVLR